MTERWNWKVWRRDRGRCAECGSFEKLEFGYIVPVSKGGKEDAHNIQILCEECNKKRGYKICKIFIPAFHLFEMEKNLRLMKNKLTPFAEITWTPTEYEKKVIYNLIQQLGNRQIYKWTRSGYRLKQIFMYQSDISQTLLELPPESKSYKILASLKEAIYLFQQIVETIDDYNFDDIKINNRLERNRVATYYAIANVGYEHLTKLSEIFNFKIDGYLKAFFQKYPEGFRIPYRPDDSVECPTLFSWDYKEEAPIRDMQRHAEKCSGKIFRVDTGSDYSLAIVGAKNVKQAYAFLLKRKDEWSSDDKWVEDDLYEWDESDE